MTLDELVTPLDADAAKAKIYDALTAQGVVTTTWKPGGVVRTIIAALALVVAPFSTLQSLIAKSGFLALAEGDWLVLVALYVYGVAKNLGTFAAGDLRFDNSTGNIYSGVAGDLIAINPSTGKTYRNTESFTIGSMATNVLIAFQAIELGSPSSSSASAITGLVTTLSGVTVTNPIALVGEDPETDPALRLRCSEKLGMLSPNGPRDAYAFVARSAVRLADGSAIGVTRVRSIPDGLGDVDVYVSSASGALTGSLGDPTSDLGKVDDDMQKLAVPLAVTLTTHNASNHSIDVVYEIWVSDVGSLSDAQIESDIEARLTAFMASRPIGGDILPGETTGRVYLSAIEAVIGASTETLKVVISVPAGDVDIAATEAPVLGTVDAFVHQVTEAII
jgi:hypothetical protein